MAHGAPAPNRMTVERYFALADQGVLRPDDRVELLEGVIVAMAPQQSRHAAAVGYVDDALRRALGDRAVTRVQCPLLLGRHSAPEPDVAVVAGPRERLEQAHPTTALLVVEVADSSLAQDRLTKAAIYAGAGIPEYWIVNLRDDQVEVLCAPDRRARRYADRRVAGRRDRVELVALPGVAVAAADLLPRRPSPRTR